MSENSKQADESGRVATGDATAPKAEPAGNGTGAGAPAAGSSDGNGAGHTPQAADPADAPTEIRPAAQNGNGAVDVTKPAEVTKPVVADPAGAQPAAAQPAPGNGVPSPHPTPSPTARPVPTPRPAEDTVHLGPAEVAGAPVGSPVDAPVDGQGVPAPGSHAETPPPWQRMPGSEPVTAVQAPVAEPPVAGGLFDGPTAYMDPADARTVEQQGGAGGPAMSAAPRRPRQAALQLKRLDPWSVLKLALVLAVVIFFIWMVAVGVLYGVLEGMGVWDRLNGTYNDLVSGEAQTGSALISAGRVFGIAAVIGAINSLLFAVAMTIGAFVYNVSADLVGGVEVTLSERD